MNTLREHLEVGKPYIMEHNTTELKTLGKGVEQATLEAHRHLYEGLTENNPNVMVFTDDEKEPKKYITFRDSHGEPCYIEFQEGNSATDIGIRGVNPDFGGVINPTTVVHADREAVKDFHDRGAPKVLVDALDAVRIFNNFIVKKVAQPYLRQVAEEYSVDPDEYVENFFPTGERAHTLTRVIMYHLDAVEGMRPIGETDGVPLLIKQHNDKSAFTIDSVQTSSGLQYYDIEKKEWINAGTEVACFRGSAESFLPEILPPTAHRVVFEEDLKEKAATNLVKVGIGRIAIPTFICPSTTFVREPVDNKDTIAVAAYC